MYKYHITKMLIERKYMSIDATTKDLKITGLPYGSTIYWNTELSFSMYLRIIGVDYGTTTNIFRLNPTNAV